LDFDRISSLSEYDILALMMLDFFPCPNLHDLLGRLFNRCPKNNRIIRFCVLDFKDSMNDIKDTASMKLLSSADNLRLVLRQNSASILLRRIVS
jgi:hypothetical protein